MLSKSHKLGKKLLETVVKKSTAVSRPYFLVRIQIGGNDYKYAVSISKKVAPSAVERNKLRRHVYRALQEVTPSLLRPIRAVFILAKPIREATYNQIKQEVEVVLMKK